MHYSLKNHVFNKRIFQKVLMYCRLKIIAKLLMVSCRVQGLECGILILGILIE